MQTCFMLSIYLLITRIYIICIHAQEIRCEQISYNDGEKNIECPEWSLGSTCEIECARKYKFVGTSQIITCTKSSTRASWTTSKGKCTERLCPVLRLDASSNTAPQYNCVRSSVGSKCSPKCTNGFEIASTTHSGYTCTVSNDQVGASWMPANLNTRCTEKICNPSYSRFKQITCTKQNKYGSECTFRCDVGSYTEDEKLLSCDFHTDSNLVKWSNTMPTCKERLCPVLRLDASSNTAPWYNCVRSSVGSKCSPKCTNGFEIASTTHFEYTCTVSNDQSGASWMPANLNTRCTEKRCNPSYSGNNRITCTKQNKYGSECTFRCDAGSYTEDEKLLSCDFHTDSNLVNWSNKMPTCKADAILPSSSTTNTLVVILPIIVGVVLLFIVVLVVGLLTRKKRKNTSTRNTTPNLTSEVNNRRDEEVHTEPEYCNVHKYETVQSVQITASQSNADVVYNNINPTSGLTSDVYEYDN